MPLDQDGVEIRPIEQLTGGSEFNEVFFTGARTDADLVVGEPGEGWAVAMGLLGFERGVSTLGQQVGFARELDGVVDAGAGRTARSTTRCSATGWPGQGRARGDPRLNALRGLSAVGRGDDSAAGGGAGSISKLVWANWHRDLGELAMDVAGPAGLLARPSGTPYDLDEWQRLFLFSRADTIYGGSDEIQRNILAERVLGLPREPAWMTDRTDPSSRPPTTSPGHDLLAGKVVVVTAAAGAGIGAAVVRRALEEGAKAVVFSDTHERRLAEAEEALGAEFGADRVRQLVCDVTDEAQVAGAARRGRRVRRRRRDGQQRRPRRHRQRRSR